MSTRNLVGAGKTKVLPDVETVLRTALQDTYEPRETVWHPCWIHENVSVQTNEETVTSHPSITASAPYVAGVEYRGYTKRRSDWQAPVKSLLRIFKLEIK
ncbi:hypothetical protein [Halorientalis halophila]|uniref:hypothetical protein n=1 Tax=Halorientalis halophila TaxID=3108499 RepID=UPI00300A03B3